MHKGDGYTPLHRACWGPEPGHTATVQALLDAGVDPREASFDGQTPLSMTENNPATWTLLHAAIKRKEAEEAEARRKSLSEEVDVEMELELEEEENDNGGDEEETREL